MAYVLTSGMQAIIQFNHQKTTLQLWILMVTVVKLCHSYDMHEQCGKEINMETESKYQLELRLDDVYIHDNYGPVPSQNWGSCETTIKAWNTSYTRLMFYFRDFDLDCSEGHLEFFSGLTGYSRVEGLSFDVCGEDKPHSVYTVDDQYLRINFVSKKSHLKTDIFSIIVTSYSEGTCASTSFKCGNSRCIDLNIACNVYDSCGDESGCYTDSDSGVAVKISLGIVVPLVGIIVAGLVFWYFRIYRKKKIVKRANGTTVAYPQIHAPQSTSNTFSQEVYGIDSQQNPTGRCEASQQRGNTRRYDNSKAQLASSQSRDSTQKGYRKSEIQCNGSTSTTSNVNDSQVALENNTAAYSTVVKQRDTNVEDTGLDLYEDVKYDSNKHTACHQEQNNDDYDVIRASDCQGSVRETYENPKEMESDQVTKGQDEKDEDSEVYEVNE